MGDFKSLLFTMACVSIILIGFQNCAGGLPSLSEAQAPSVSNGGVPACRAGFWSVSDGRLCMENTLRMGASIDGYNGTANASTLNAIHVCKSVGPGARVCTHNDFQQACADFASGSGSVSVNPYGAQPVGVYGDHASIGSGQTSYNPGGALPGHIDDVYLTWNSATCADNNDGPGRHENETSSFAYRCCY